MKAAEKLIERYLKEGRGTDPKLHQAVMSWLDNKGSETPSRSDAIQAMKKAGVADPEKSVSEFFSHHGECSADSNFDDEE